MGTFEASPIITALISSPNASLNGGAMMELQSGLEVTHYPQHTMGMCDHCCVSSYCRKKKNGCTCRVLRVGSELHTMSLPFSPTAMTLLFPRCIPAMGHYTSAVSCFQEGRIENAFIAVRCGMC